MKKNTVNVADIVRLPKNRDQKADVMYVTKNLNQFKAMRGNRQIDDLLVKRIAKSIEKEGFMRNPIIVNSRREVVDGQHRLAAARLVGSEVFYIVGNYSLSQVQQLNINQRNWGKKDYLLSYCSQNKKEYLKLKKFWDKNKEFSLDNCIGLARNLHGNDPSRDYSTKETRDLFKTGDWEGRDWKLAQKWADMIKKTKPYYKNYNAPGFVKVMIYMFKHPKFDFNVFMAKLPRGNNRNILKERMTMSEYKLAIETIYNVGNTKGTCVTLRR